MLILLAKLRPSALSVFKVLEMGRKNFYMKVQVEIINQDPPECQQSALATTSYHIHILRFFLKM